jgi:hypothetical protein
MRWLASVVRLSAETTTPSWHTTVTARVIAARFSRRGRAAGPMLHRRPADQEPCDPNDDL